MNICIHDLTQKNYDESQYDPTTTEKQDVGMECKV